MNFEKKNVNFVIILLIKNDGVSSTRSPNKWMNFRRRKNLGNFIRILLISTLSDPAAGI